MPSVDHPLSILEQAMVRNCSTRDTHLHPIAKRVTLSQAGARLKLGLELNQAELSPALDLLLGP